MAKYVMAHILDVPYHADIEYSYKLLPEHEEQVSVGSLVIVPFGASNRQKTALVTAIADECPHSEVKSIVSVLNEYMSLDSDMLSLCEFMKAQTLCTIGEATKCIVPSVIATRVNERLFVTDKSADKLPSEHSIAYDYIKENNGITLEKLKERLSGAQNSALWLLKNKGIHFMPNFISQKDKEVFDKINLDS